MEGDAVTLALLVQYVRSQVQMLDNLSSEVLFSSSIFFFFFVFLMNNNKKRNCSLLTSCGESQSMNLKELNISNTINSLFWIP